MPGSGAGQRCAQFEVDIAQPQIETRGWCQCKQQPIAVTKRRRTEREAGISGAFFRRTVSIAPQARAEIQREILARQGETAIGIFEIEAREQGGIGSDKIGREYEGGGQGGRAPRDG